MIAAPRASRADFQTSSEWFHSKTEKDRFVLQGMMILLGNYVGLIDGEFGRRTYDAVVAYEVAEGLSVDGVLTPPEERQMFAQAAVVYDELGFTDQTDSHAGIDLPIPTKLFATHASSQWGTRWESADDGVELETLAIPGAETTFAALFARLSRAGDRTIEYSLRRDSIFVLSGTVGPRRFYTTFVRSEGMSRGFSVSWTPSRDKVGRTISAFLASMAKFGVSFPDRSKQGTAPEEEEPPTAGVFSGSGFVVSDGVIVTNAHVVEGCTSIEVPGDGAATLLSVDTDADLAAIRLSNERSSAIARIQTTALELGQEVVALGYPLPDIMGDALTVSPGVVSSLSGVAGSKANFTVSANIQPGNSGGPVLDMHGDVVGVTVSKLNEIAMLKAAGTTGASFGFAINTETLVHFLGPFQKSVTAEGAPGRRQCPKSGRRSQRLHSTDNLPEVGASATRGGPVAPHRHPA
jgi:S1-C subfamily serine protease